VIRSIRWRIGLSVLLVFTALQLVLAAYLLDRWKVSARETVDERLSGHIRALRLHPSPEEIASYISSESEEEDAGRDHGQIFFEVRVAGKALASPSLPSEGLGSAPAQSLSRTLESSPYLLRIWERPDPSWPDGAGHVVRVAELRLGENEWRVARSLDRVELEYSAFRANLLRGLLAVSLLGAGGAWWVARRSLVPLDAMTQRARELGSLADGSLPRTGTGDELDRLGEVLNVLLDGFRSQVLHVRRVSADAAHALRTPLAAMRASLELHIQRASAQERLVLLPILESLDETIGMIQRLLFLESVEANPLDPESAEVLKLESLVQDLVETLEPIAQERDIFLGSALAPAQVRGDPAQLRSAILNLLENAIQNTPDGGAISVSLEAKDAMACLAVEDSGCGLRPDQLERVFERFYSERRGGGGTGIGLPIALAIAHAHGGTLTASSPAGARFELALPLYPTGPE
jgi:signal transduction histidine kinase